MIIFLKRQVNWIIVLISVLFSVELPAIETNSSDFMINGFGTLGLTKSSDDDLGYRESVTQKGVFDEYDFGQNSALGIQANYKATDKLDFGIQFLAKQQYKNALDKSIHWAYTNYHVMPNLNFRFGRIGVGSFMISDYKEVGFTHLWAHLPADFYGPHPVDSVDGMDVQFKKSIFEGLLRAKLWFGKGKYDFNSADSSEINLKRLLGTSLSWEDDNWNLRLTYSQANSKIDNDSIKPLEAALHAASLAGWPEAAAYTDLTFDDKIVRYYSAGVSYDNSDWLIQSEIGLINTDAKLTPGNASGYLSIGRKLGAVTPYILGSWMKAHHDRLIMPTPAVSAYIPLQQISQFVFNQFYASQHTVSLGARWDVQPKVSLKAQWDRKWVDGYGSALLSKSAFAVADERQLDIFSLTVDFLF